MNLKEIKEELPNEVRMQLMSSEKIYYFSYITFEGGCGSNKEVRKYWIALSDKRVLYKTKILDIKGGNSFSVEKNGDLPFSKISFIEVSEELESKGCSNSKIFQLRISSSGGTIIIPIPTKEKGYQVRKIYSELNNEN